MEKSCLNCEHGEPHDGKIFHAKCTFDAGELIQNPTKEAENCQFYEFCEQEHKQ